MILNRNLSKPQFPHLQSGDNSPFLTGLSARISEICLKAFHKWKPFMLRYYPVLPTPKSLPFHLVQFWSSPLALSVYFSPLQLLARPHSRFWAGSKTEILEFGAPAEPGSAEGGSPVLTWLPPCLQAPLKVPRGCCVSFYSGDRAFSNKAARGQLIL